VTFGNVGELALIARSQIHLTGDAAHVTSIGLEAGLP
jgi:hypothetical protein